MSSRRLVVIVPLVVLCFGLAAFLFADPLRIIGARFGRPSESLTALPTARLVFPDGFRMTVEVAQSPEEQALGLGERDTLPEDHGMLFVYGTPAQPSFWMKGMQFDLDMIWIDGDRIVGVTADIPKESFRTLQTFSPPVPVTAVLEVNAGFAARHGLAAGAILEMP